FDMIDGSQIAEETFQFVIGKRERITTRQNHLSNAFALPDVIQRDRVVFAANKELLLAGEVLTQTIPAINRAKIRYEKQDTIRIAVNDPLHRRMFSLSQRIQNLLSVATQLPCVRHQHFPYRIRRLSSMGQRRIIGRRANLEERALRRETFFLIGAQMKYL